MTSIDEIRRLDRDDDARACATIMSGTDPWITLKRDFAQCLAIISDQSREVYVAHDDAGVAGFVIIDMGGAFVGYIRTLAVRDDRRGSGLGSRLVAFAEDRIFRDSPNVFMCVSSFNPRAKALYERLGYAVVGELVDYVVRGHSEWLLRKSTGPTSEFRRRT